MLNNTHGRILSVGLAFSAVALASAGCESAAQPLSRAVDPTEQAGGVYLPQNQPANAQRDSHTAGHEHATARDPGCGCSKAHACDGRAQREHREHATHAPKGQSCAGASNDEVCAPGHAVAGSDETSTAGFDSPPPVGAKARCPVMGNEFRVEAETARSEHDGRHYVFCCPGCKPKFDAAPEKYL